MTRTSAEKPTYRVLLERAVDILQVLSEDELGYRPSGEGGGAGRVLT